MRYGNVTYNEAIKVPLISDHFVLKEVIGTAWYTIDLIVAAHNTGNLTHSDA